MPIVERTVTVGNDTITFQTGKVAKQAGGATWVRSGDTVLLVTAQSAPTTRTGIDFLPLTVDYQEKLSAAGRIPGGYFRRETKARDDETLVSRMIDRSIRPLFSEGWTFESQVIANVFSFDPNHPSDTLAMCGASLALMLSDMPFLGPIAGVRVCRVNGQFVANPTHEQKGEADLNLFVSSSKSAIVMVEGGGEQIPEAVMIDALLFAYESAQPIIKAQEEILAEAGGRAKRAFTPPKRDEALVALVREFVYAKLEAAYAIAEKQPRYAALDKAHEELLAQLAAKDPALSERRGEVEGILEDLKYNLVRQMIIKTKKRIDKRGLTDVRPITTEVSYLPRTHGSALFTRGETQALVVATLGTRQDEQKLEELTGDRYANFLLHYSFPPFSVGEVKMLRGPGRREVGHGALARRALEALIELDEDFPYTVRVTSEILESNGSSSMATVCGGSLALMDAGVPMKGPCAGIAMGLIKEGDDVAVLTDILGDEDHLGDMDFKVAGTAEGITAIQMDIKVTGVDRKILETALEQARQGRLHILSRMAESIDKTRPELSLFAPRITSFKIKVDRIRDVIGPGGKVIKDIVARTGCQVNVEDDGTVRVASADGEAAQRAIKMIKDLTQEAEIGKLYLGNVRKITDFGAFVEIFPGTDGLVHISELAPKRVKRVEDVLQEGDEVLVKCIGIDGGKVKLSRKQALEDEQRQREKAQSEPQPS